MIDEIYREIIEDSPVGYICVEVGDINNIDSELKIIDMNKHYKIIEKQYNFNLELLLLEDKCLREQLFSIFKIVDKHKKYYLVKFISENNINVKVHIYKGENKQFHFRFDKLSPSESAKLHPIFRNAPFAAWIKDREGKYLDVNQRFLKIVNKSYEEVICKSDYDIWPKEYADIFTIQDQLILKNNEKFSKEDLIYDSENNEVYTQTIKWPFKDENKETLGIVGVGIEINNKIELKKNIEKNERLFEEISNNIEDIIIIRDDKKAQYVSNSFEKVFGCNADRLYDDITSWHEEWNNIDMIDGSKNYDDKEVVSNTVRVKNKKFDKWLVSKFVPIMNERGEVIKKVGVISDITKKKELEEKLETLRMDFFANISHEIRTPITLILSCVQVFISKLNNSDSSDKEYYHKYLCIMKQNSYRLLKLVNNLIDTTRIDSGNFTYKPENYDIVRFVENICLSVSDFVELNKMSIEFDTDEEEQIIGFDLDNMERVVLNLLSNAIKYGKKNGKIEVGVSCGENIKISVKDNGIGIPKDKQERVFERFGQVKNKMKTEHEGSGIGLFLVKSLVQLNGGEITLDSQLGKGSEFIITLPNAKTEDKEVEITIKENSCKIDKMNIEFSDIYL